MLASFLLLSIVCVLLWTAGDFRDDDNLYL